MARGGTCVSLEEAMNVFDEVKGSIICKPHRGSRGRHTTLNINSREALKRAFAIAKQLTRWVEVEEELVGIIHRVTIIGTKSIAIVRRDPPMVVGDGVSTIQQLIGQTNADPRRDGFMFCPLLINDRLHSELVRQGLTLDSIPPQGAQVIVNDKISRLHGTTTDDVTDHVPR